MNFREFVEAKQQYPTSVGAVPPPPGSPYAPKTAARQLAPQDTMGQQMQQQRMGQRTGDNYQQQMMRLANQQYTPEEQQIVNKQKQEMKRFGVVFTPFKFYGGAQNPQSSLVNPDYQGKPDLSQFKFQ